MHMRHIDSIRFYIPISALPAYAEKYNADAIGVDYNEDKMRLEVYAFYREPNEHTVPVFDFPEGIRQPFGEKVVITSDLSDGSLLLYENGETVILRPKEETLPF